MRRGWRLRVSLRPFRGEPGRPRTRCRDHRRRRALPRRNWRCGRGCNRRTRWHRRRWCRDHRRRRARRRHRGGHRQRAGRARRCHPLAHLKRRLGCRRRRCRQRRQDRRGNRPSGSRRRHFWRRRPRAGWHGRRHRRLRPALRDHGRRLRRRRHRRNDPALPRLRLIDAPAVPLIDVVAGEPGTDAAQVGHEVEARRRAPDFREVALRLLHLGRELADPVENGFRHHLGDDRQAGRRRRDTLIACRCLRWRRLRLLTWRLLVVLKLLRWQWGTNEAGGRCGWDRWSAADRDAVALQQLDDGLEGRAKRCDQADELFVDHRRPMDAKAFWIPRRRLTLSISASASSGNWAIASNQMRSSDSLLPAAATPERVVEALTKRTRGTLSQRPTNVS